MGKVDLKENSVAYFDDVRVAETGAGFYILSGPRSSSLVKVQDVEFATEQVLNEETGEIADTIILDHRGQPVILKVTGSKEIEVEHETEMEPFQRVYPSPDGEGFVYEAPGEEETG